MANNGTENSPEPKTGEETMLPIYFARHVEFENVEKYEGVFSESDLDNPELRDQLDVDPKDKVVFYTGPYLVNPYQLKLSNSAEMVSEKERDLLLRSHVDNLVLTEVCPMEPGAKFYPRTHCSRLEYVTILKRFEGAYTSEEWNQLMGIDRSRHYNYVNRTANIPLLRELTDLVLPHNHMRKLSVSLLTGIEVNGANVRDMRRSEFIAESRNIWEMLRMSRELSIAWYWQTHGINHVHGLFDEIALIEEALEKDLYCNVSSCIETEGQQWLSNMSGAKRKRRKGLSKDVQSALSELGAFTNEEVWHQDTQEERARFAELQSLMQKVAVSVMMDQAMTSRDEKAVPISHLLGSLPFTFLAKWSNDARKDEAFADLVEKVRQNHFGSESTPESEAETKARLEFENFMDGFGG